MTEAAAEIKENKGKMKNEIIDVGVSCDGTWQKRGFQSNNMEYLPPYQSILAKFLMLRQ